jgi:hypothetical protein
MKCELCKRDLDWSCNLCETCADAIQRLVRITKGPLEFEPEKQRHRTADTAG